MKPQRLIAETTTPEGGRLALFEHDGSYAIRLNGQPLMDTKATASELRLGEVGVAGLEAGSDARVLIGGLGFGYTLRSVLDGVPATATVHVAELLPDVVSWNREHLRKINGALLDDPRVTVVVEDVSSVLLQAARAPYDSILLDIDNGPCAMVQEGNSKLYNDSGIRLVRAALRPGGRVVVWSAGEDAAFVRRLERAGFAVETVRAKRHPGARRAGVVLYVATLRCGATRL